MDESRGLFTPLPTAYCQLPIYSPSGYSSKHNHRLISRDDPTGQGHVRRLMRDILPAYEIAQIGPPLFRDMVSNRATQHGKLYLECIQHRTYGDLSLYFHFYLTSNVCQRPQMVRKADTDRSS